MNFSFFFFPFFFSHRSLEGERGNSFDGITDSEGNIVKTERDSSAAGILCRHGTAVTPGVVSSLTKSLLKFSSSARAHRFLNSQQNAREYRGEREESSSRTVLARNWANSYF